MRTGYQGDEAVKIGVEQVFVVIEAAVDQRAIFRGIEAVCRRFLAVREIGVCFLITVQDKGVCISCDSTGASTAATALTAIAACRGFHAVFGIRSDKGAFFGITGFFSAFTTVATVTAILTDTAVS